MIYEFGKYTAQHEAAACARREAAFRDSVFVTVNGRHGEERVISPAYRAAAARARLRWELEHIEWFWGVHPETGVDYGWRANRPPVGWFHEHDTRAKFRRKATK